MKSFIYPTAKQSLWECLKTLPSGVRYQVTVDEYSPKRSLDQNAKLHALCSDIAKQKQWGGEWLETEDWKRIMTAGWMKATGRVVKLVPDLEGNGFIPLYQKTSKLNVKQGIELIEFIQAWMVDNEIHFYDSLTNDPQQTG